MFANLDDINWEDFGSAHIAVGMKTNEIPDRIRNLLNDDPGERDYAIACLLGEGQHLGMLGEATPAIIPFVLEVLADPGYASRDYLIMGLAFMFPHMFRTKSFERLRLSLRVYDEIKKGYPLYKRLLADPSNLVRRFAAQVMANMQYDRSDAVATLFARLAVESDEETRSEIIKALLQLITDVISPYSEAGTQAIVSLYDYLKSNGSFKEQVQFAEALKAMKFILFKHKDINAFVQEVLTRSESQSTD